MWIQCIKNKITRLNQNVMIRNGIIFTFFAFLNQGLNFLLLLILTQFLTTEMYGKLNLFNTYLLFINIFIMLNTTGLVGVNFFKVTRTELQKTIYSIISIGMAISIISIIILIVFSKHIENISGFKPFFFGLAIIYCFFNNISSINLVLWRSEQKVFQYGIFSASLALLNTLITILLIVTFNSQWESRIYAQFIISCLFVIISIKFLVQRKYINLKERPCKKFYIEDFKFGIPLIPNAISWWATQGVNRIFINNFFGLSSVGYFSFSANICNLIQVVGSSFYQSYQVDIYKEIQNSTKESKRNLRDLTIRITYIYIIITGLFFIISYTLVPIFFPAYAKSSTMFLPLCLGAFFSNMQQLFISYLYYFKKTSIIMYINMSCTLISLILGYLLIKYNILIAAYLICLTQATIFILTFLYSQKLYPIYSYFSSKRQIN